MVNKLASICVAKEFMVTKLKCTDNDTPKHSLETL